MNEQLKIAILRSPLDQPEIAQRAGIHETRLSGIINNRIFPNLREMTAIAGILGMQVAELWDLKPSQSETNGMATAANS